VLTQFIQNQLLTKHLFEVVKNCDTLIENASKLKMKR